LELRIHGELFVDALRIRVSTSTDGSSTRPRTARTAWVGASYCTNWYRATGTSTVPVRYRYNCIHLTCPGACDRGYFRGEGREAGKVRNVAGESAWENLRQDLLLLVRKID